MIKIRVHIETEDLYMDDRVYKEIILPSVPRVGDWVSINKDVLHEMACSSLDIAKDYREWMYGKSSDRVMDYNYRITKEDLENLSFDDAGPVKSVCFREGNDYVDIEIGA